MFLECIQSGMMGSNCYVVGSGTECAIIDAGVNSQEIYKVLSRENLKAKYIILTHGHIDHIIYLSELHDMTGAKVLIHQDDKELLTDPRQNFSITFWKEFVFREPVTLLTGGEVLTLGDMKLEIIHTPGHSGGGICIKTNNVIFTGDTLFKASIGRADLMNSDFDKLKESIATLISFSDEYIVYPGHGESTTIGEERNRAYMRYMGIHGLTKK